MRAFQAILLIFVFSLPFQAKLVIVSHYLLNQELIADEFCVNKEKKELECNGKCHLNKELKGVDPEHESQSFPVLKSQNLECFVTETNSFEKLTAQGFTRTFKKDEGNYCHNAGNGVFHPPRSRA